jgi:tetratricopeptide (TPR) repeat protein
MKKLVIAFFCSISLITVRAQDSINEALAYQYYQQGDYEKAVSIFSKMFNSSFQEGYFDLYYQSLLRIKRYDEAEILVKKAIKQFPKSSRYQIALGRIYQEKGKGTEAEKIFQAAIQNAPKTEFHFRELANSFYAIEAYDMAINTFTQGRRELGNEQLFTYELLSIYRFKRDKVQIINEYLNALSFEPQLLLQAQSTMASLFEGSSDYFLLQAALLKRLQKDPDNEIFAELLTWQYIQQQNYEMAYRQLIAQDKRVKTSGEALYNAGNTFVANKAYTTALKAFEYLLAKGPENTFYVPAKVQLINAKYELALQSKFDKDAVKTLANDFTEILKQYGYNPQTLFAVKKLANLQAYHLQDFDAAETTLEKAISTGGISATDIAQLKLDLGDVYVINKQPWEALLMYEQVSKTYENLPVGSDARFRSARLSFYQGNFQFAKSQADVLKASTSQLIANDAMNLSLLISDNLRSKNDSLALIMYADAEMLQFTNNITPAFNKLDSIDVKFPNNSLTDDILLAKAKLFIKTNDFESASVNLKSILDSHSNSIWIDDAIFMLAELYEHKLSNLEEAKKLYQQLITDFPGSMLTVEARKRYRILRGDNMGT